MISKEEISAWLQNLQDTICQGLEELDGKATFHQDLWDRPEGGGGRSRAISEGHVFEKGGVNFSAVEGPTPKKILEALGLPDLNFFATGVSIVLHPVNPFVPIIHMNVRYFEMTDGTYWFGGGIDLTPHYVVDEEAKSFHHALKKTCDTFDSSYYPKFKTWADDYFFIKHRNETRGIGGIFFDRLTGKDADEKANLWSFLQSVGNTFLPAYSKLVLANHTKPFDESHKNWQLLRRGRYVEFNLVYDKGTKFGLDTNGRTESILMSMPPHADWQYNHQPAPESPEEITLSKLKKGIDWVE